MYYGSKYFSAIDFACKCRCGFGTVESDIAEPLVQVLHTVRTTLNVPLILNSGARCNAHNEIEGGKPLSAHLAAPSHALYAGQCRAADIRVSNGWLYGKILECCVKAGIKRFGFARTFIHIDVAVGIEWPEGVWFY